MALEPVIEDFDYVGGKFVLKLIILYLMIIIRKNLRKFAVNFGYSVNYVPKKDYYKVLELQEGAS